MQDEKIEIPQTKVDDQGQPWPRISYPKYKEGEATVREVRVAPNYGKSLIRTIVAKYTCKFPSWTTSKWCLFSKSNIYIYRRTSTGFLVLTLSQQVPLETILENTRLMISSFDLIFSKIINFPFLINVNFVEKKNYLHKNNMIYIIKNERLYQNKVNSSFDCNCRIGYYCLSFSFRCRCSVCLYYYLFIHILLVYVSGGSPPWALITVNRIR